MAQHLVQRADLRDGDVEAEAFEIFRNGRDGLVDRAQSGFRRDAHPMAIMCGVVGALSAFYHDSTDIADPEQRKISAHRLIAKMPTIAAMAYTSDGKTSSVRYATYALHGAAPVFAPGDGEYVHAPTVTLTAPTSDTVLHYTSDGTTPTSSHGTQETSAVRMTT